MENLEKNSTSNEQIWNMDEFLNADSPEHSGQTELTETEKPLEEKKEYVYDENVLEDNKDEKIAGIDFTEDIAENEDDKLKRFTYTRYLLDDGTYYETVKDKAFLSNKFVADICHSYKESLDEFTFPRNEEEVREFCHSALMATACYYTSSVTRGKEDEATKYFKRVAEIRLDLAKDFSPLWWGRKSGKYPRLEYHGGNPYNMFGQDHKYDYLLKNEERKEVLKTRELEMRIARGDTQISSEDILVYLYGDRLDEEREKS